LLTYLSATLINYSFTKSAVFLTTLYSGGVSQCFVELNGMMEISDGEDCMILAGFV